VPVLEPLVFRSTSLHYERGQAKDIENYIRSAIYTHLKSRKWRKEDKEQVIEVLAEKGAGM
jgi:hypothetical protein